MNRIKFLTLSMTTVCLLCFSPMLFAESVEQEVTDMLNTFLAGASSDAAAHDHFWADDLVYTSSNGSRFGKAEIMAGFESKGETESAEPEAVVIYSAKEVLVRQFGEAAVLTFKLLGTSTTDPEAVDEYFNTGTFVKRDGLWQVVAWQATKIPAEE